MSADKVGTGYVPIRPDTDGFGKELERGLDREGTPAAKKSAGKITQAMKGVFFGGAALMAKSVFDFSGFEKQMNEVFTLLPGISGPAMDRMTEQVKDFSTEFGVLPDQVVPALYQSLSAGVPADNVFAFITTAQQLAKGGVTDLTTAVDGLSSVVNAYGPGVLSAEKASDLLFTTVKLGKTNIAELSSQIFQVTPTAAGLGLSFDNVTAALAAMTLQGVPTSVATTQLRQLLVELSKEGSGAADVFQQLAGKSFRDFIAGGGNLADALDIMNRGAAATGSSISDMFGSVEAGSAALALSGAGAETFRNDLAAMGDASGATKEAFDRMNKGLGPVLDKLKAKFSVAMLNIGDSIAPTVEKLGGLLSKLLDGFAKIPGPIQTVILLFGTLSAGAFAFAKPIMNGIELFGKLNGVFSKLAANPWMLAVLALVAVTVVIIKNWDKVKAALSATWDWIKSAASAVGSFFVGIWTKVSGAVTAAWDALTGAISASISFVVGIVTGFAGAVASIFGAITSTIAGAWNTVSSMTSTAWNAVSGIVSGIGGGIVNFITAIPRTIGSAFSTLADVISKPFSLAFNLIKTLWNDTVGGFGFTVPSWVPLVGGKGFKIPEMAAGGVLSGPQLFIGGEYPGAKQNPEIVAPQNVIRSTVVEALQIAGEDGGGLTVNGPLIGHAEIRSDQDIVKLSRELAREIEREKRASGKRFGSAAA